MDIVAVKIDKLQFFISPKLKRNKVLDSIIDVGQSKFDKAAEILEKIQRIVTLDCIDKKLIDNSQHIRVNVFLPTLKHEKKGHTFVLKMPSLLMCGDYLDSEAEISFCCGQGATGKVYETNKPDFNRSKNYRIPKYLEDKIHPGLKWWASYPLIDETQSVIGVLNIDGLNCELPENEKGNLDNIIKHHKVDLEKELNKLPRIDLFVVYKSR
ncbi:MAG: hypothetical protein MI922_10130 [Bacteroidales bacterium]|nr:hypothetical protein [Bacteroidales bacterium]